MSAERDAMIAALSGIEADLVSLSTRVASFTTNYTTASQAAFGQAEKNRQVTFEARVGPQNLHTYIRQRLNGLGFADLYKLRATGKASASWVSEFTTLINGLVP